MKELKGISASPGIVMGKAFVYLDENFNIPNYTISTHEVEGEYKRFLEASEKARQEIEDLKKRSSSKMGEDEAQFLDSHILMLSDPDFQENVQTGLEKELKNVEWVVYLVAREVIDKLKSSQDSYLRERTIDVHDVSKRILNHLLYRDRISLEDISEEVVLITRNLLPSDAIGMNKRFIKGIAMDVGGKTSHTAILARAFEIPAVLGLSSISKEARTGEEIIIDGNTGTVIVEPDEETRKEYLKTMLRWQKRESQLLTLNELAAETKDGKLVLLKSNIEIPEETESALAHGADGVGLYRSEFLMMQPGVLESEEMQFDAYKRVLEEMGNRPVTIRTLDVGGDKSLPGIQGVEEKNPILGWRAVRYCLSHPHIFKIQLRALLRASVYGDLRIMFPMISGLEELENVLELLEQEKQYLREKGVSFKEKLPVGIMIEVPSAALTSDILARKVDFFSIGTNDLIQYTIAVDRGNEKIAYLYEPFHPGVLRLIKMIAENAHAAGIPVSMCGEMAGDPYAAVILLGLGLDIFSMSSVGIPEVKKIIRSVNLSEAEELVGTIMEMRSYNEIDTYVKEYMDERFDLSVF